MKRKAITQNTPNKKPVFRRQNASLINPTGPKKIGEEKKNLDVNQASPIAFGQATATVALLNGIAQGYTETQRVGRNVHMKSIFYRFVGNMAATTTGSSAIRLLIIYDKQSNTAQPPTTTILNADSIEQPMNLFYNKRFIVILDEEIECLGTQGPQAFYRKGYRKINLPIEFSGNGAAITSISTGSIYSLVYQSGGLLVANPSSQLFTRIRYVDA